MDIGNEYLQKMYSLAPTILIDPLSDLGLFDYRLLKFVEPISSLKNKITGAPYAKKWIPVIEEMRQIYIEWQREVQKCVDGSHEKRQYATKDYQKENKKEAVENLLSLGFSIRYVAKKTGYSEKNLKNSGVRRGELNQRTERAVFRKSDLRKGIIKNINYLTAEEINGKSSCPITIQVGI